MKAKLFFLFMLALVTFANAQKDDLVFFMKDGASGIHEAKCADMGELWVKVPVPSDIADYDNFTVFVYLSTIDYNLRASFSKDQISKKLVGKDYIDLFLLGPQGTNKTDFGDETVYNDLCNTPRNKGISNFEVNVYTKAFKILRYESETYWDEARSSYITRDNPIWDEGENYSASKFTVIQTALSDGVNDTKSTISLKIPNLSASAFKNSEPGYGDQYLSHATIVDNSIGQEICMRVMAMNASTFSLEAICADFTKWIAPGTAVYNPDFHFPQAIDDHMEPDWRAKFNDVKDKALSDFTIGSISGKQFTWYQPAHFDEYGSSLKLHPGVYCRLFFFQHGTVTYIACAALEDNLKEEYRNVSYSAPTPFIKKDFFSYKITPEDAAKTDELIKQVMESINFLF